MPSTDNFLPIDVYVAGCPPRPDALLHSIMQLREKIDRESAGRPKSG